VILGEKELLQAAAKARILRSSGIGEKLLRAGNPA
jgi:hypothetical protein